MDARFFCPISNELLRELTTLTTLTAFLRKVFVFTRNFVWSCPPLERKMYSQNESGEGDDD